MIKIECWHPYEGGCDRCWIVQNCNIRKVREVIQ